MNVGVHHLHTLEIQVSKSQQFLSSAADVNRDAVSMDTHPEKAEGWYVMPRWQAVADTYPKAVEAAFELLIISRPDTIEYSPLQLKGACQHPRTARIFNEIYRAQQSDLLLLPAQLGFQYTGWSVQQVQGTLKGSEFGLDTFAVAYMLAMHPGRMIRLDAGSKFQSKWINCPGDGDHEGAGWFFMNPTLHYGLIPRGESDPISVGSATAWRPIPRGKSW